MSKCIDCENEVNEKINTVWCPDCNAKRIKRISKQLDTMILSFGRKE